MPALYKRNRFEKDIPYGIIAQWNCYKLMTSLIHYALCLVAVGCLSQEFWIYLILQVKILFYAFEAGDIVCWLVNLPIAKLDLFKSADCRWMCKTYAEFCYRNSATVSRLVQSPTLQNDNFVWVSQRFTWKGIRVSLAWLGPASSEAGNELQQNEALYRIKKCDEEERSKRWVLMISASTTAIVL